MDFETSQALLSIGDPDSRVNCNLKSSDGPYSHMHATLSSELSIRCEGRLTRVLVKPSTVTVV